jgi:hypothetical protein
MSTEQTAEKKNERVTLCIAEPYYILGKFRKEEFENMKLLEHFRSQLEKQTTTWILGEPEPKRRVRT